MKPAMLQYDILVTFIWESPVLYAKFSQGQCCKIDLKIVDHYQERFCSKVVNPLMFLAPGFFKYV